MKKVKVSFFIEVPDYVPTGDVINWIEYQLELRGDIKGNHPLINYGWEFLQPQKLSVCQSN